MCEIYLPFLLNEKYRNLSLCLDCGILRIVLKKLPFVLNTIFNPIGLHIALLDSFAESEHLFLQFC